MNTKQIQEFYRAHLARDARFDGKFFVAVKTTKIYCRPICPAKKAKLENLTFYIHAAQAEEAGYRPCLRCRPETAPGSAAWLGTSIIVQRAISLMDHHEEENLSISRIADRLNVSERWLRELFQTQVGASPQAIFIAKKLDVARNLLDNSSASITNIAFSSGFNSIRRFNDAFKTRFGQNPSSFRKTPSHKSSLELELSYRPPYAWDKMIAFLKQRSVTGVEQVNAQSYQRLIIQNNVRGWFRLTHQSNHKIHIELKLDGKANILDFIARIKNLLDLDADPLTVENSLKEDPKLKKLLAKHSGLRIPGCWEGFELAVRAIIGQKISVKAARTILGRLTQACGEKQCFDANLKLTRFFPTPVNILNADLSMIGLTRSKIVSLKSLAEQVFNKSLLLDGSADYQTTCEQLLAINGIGPWTVEYIAMRALKNPNAFPATDLEIKKKMSQFNLNAQKWSPWRAYAATLLLNLTAEDFL